MMIFDVQLQRIPGQDRDKAVNLSIPVDGEKDIASLLGPVGLPYGRSDWFVLQERCGGNLWLRASKESPVGMLFDGARIYDVLRPRDTADEKVMKANKHGATSMSRRIKRGGSIEVILANGMGINIKTRTN